MTAAAPPPQDLVTALGPLVGAPRAGRTFSGRHRVRVGDIDPLGALRLDAVVRTLQDVANDDAHDSGIDNPGAWVVRSTVLDVLRPAVLREDLLLTTWCSGTGACWAERRTTVTGNHGAHYEAATLWVQLDEVTGRPLRLGASFRAVYNPSTAGRTVKARLVLPEAMPGDAPRRPFPLRRSDLDVMGHVNNAVYWAMLEEVTLPASPQRTVIEHHRAMQAGERAEVCRAAAGVWVLGDGALAAVAWHGAVPVPDVGSADQSSNR